MCIYISLVSDGDAVHDDAVVDLRLRADLAELPDHGQLQRPLRSRCNGLCSINYPVYKVYSVEFKAILMYSAGMKWAIQGRITSICITM